eukprot:scaffold226061_cov13-Tisochrysis_lutea.AAC.1
MERVRSGASLLFSQACSVCLQMLKDLCDKELDFNGQLHKSWVVREPDHRTADLVLESIEAVVASLIV